LSLAFLSTLPGTQRKARSAFLRVAARRTERERPLFFNFPRGATPRAKDLMRIFYSFTRSIASRHTPAPLRGARSHAFPATMPAGHGALSPRELRRLVAEMLG
jgi:hypothetical protein